MRKNTSNFLISLCVILFSSLLQMSVSCSNNERDAEKVTIDNEITEITNITETSAVVSADLNSNGNENVLFRGICIGTQTNPTINDTKHQEQGNVLGLYTAKFENLPYNTKFYARPFITTNSKTIYGNEITFTTKNISVPTVSTLEVSSVTQNSAVFNGKIENDDSSKLLSKGFYFSKTNSKPEYKDQKIESNENFEFSNSVTDLEPNTIYYVRAFASNLAGTALGEVVSFKTTSFVLPTVSTTVATSILENTAVSGGVVLQEGSNPVTERGVCWDTAPNPTITYDRTKDGNGAGSFTSNLKSLKPFTQYYVRAYATSAAGTSYGQQIWVKTIGGDKPTVEASVSASKNTVYITVKVLKQGSDNITAINAKCFDMDGNNVGKLVSGSGWSNSNIYAPVTFEISGLSSKSKYYIVGSATNSLGTSTSEKIYITTL
ncbi:hypothetical protein [Flavobacterium sp. S87F.05.LMB.W.Kidney.N]|uniref:hypothetical protein n=1 Tax=Flavobacterium sp. S87F.05.LMB.W.Kidney.N TaxID=1278758 RepID=UPI001065246D|nr:hypothetical protein [Flavobacterium sp. S87F.05.LMB.W.Kidney.N]TDX11326.1 hypothetical protein EDB96_2111 [Flavobacterium sp. S87F.05.LMB.W.Kidney.N]